VASDKRKPAPRPIAKAPTRTGALSFWATEQVPEGVEFTGVLRTPGARPLIGILGVIIGIGSFFAFTPLLTQLLAVAYWLATGRATTFPETYKTLLSYEVPFGMVAAQLGIALLIPISAAVILTIHHVRPAYLFSVRPGLRWRALFIFLPVAFVALNAVLLLQNALAGRPFVLQPQEGFVGFLIAILLTSPLQAAAEEVFFRGYLLQALGSLASSKWVGIVGSAFVFALFHGTQNAWLFGSRFAFGVLAALLVVYLGGLEAGIAAHIVNNMCAFVYAGLSTGIAKLKATTEVTPMDAVGEVVMYAVFTLAALGVGRALRLRSRTSASGLGEVKTVR